MIFWRGEGSRRAGAGLRFAEEWAAEEILDQVGSRLAAGRGLLDIKICMPTRQGIVCGRLKASRRICRVQSRYGSPPGRSFCAYKRNQNTLGAAPQDPLTLKLRLDTNWTFQQMLTSRSVRRRRYALKVPAAHFILDTAETELNAACGTLSASSNPAPGSRRFGFPGGMYRRVGSSGRSPE